jgi:hypothetical protein
MTPWQALENKDLVPMMKRATIFVEHIDSSTDFDRVQEWLKKWGVAVRVEDYSSGGWEHLWDVEAPEDALAELPREFFCSSEWAGLK